MLKKLFIFYVLFEFAAYALTVIDPIFTPPNFTTGTQPTCPSDSGCFGYNTDLKNLQYWNGAIWTDVDTTTLKTWEANTDYKANQIVNTGSDGNWLFKVVNDHRSTNVPADFRLGRIMAIAPPIITTGVQDGGQVSLAGNLATIQGGTGYIAKYGTSPSAWPLITIVEWTTQNIIVPSTGIHALYIDATGQLILGAPTNDLEDILRSAQDDTISVAIVDMNLGLIYDRKTFPTNPVGQLRGLSFFFGVMTKGLSYAAAGLQLSRSQHDVYFWGADPFNPYNPNQKTVPALSIADFFEFKQNGPVLPAVRVTTLKNTVYDNNGTLTTMTNNRWGFIRIYSSPGSDNYIMYSQAQYQTEVDAKEAAVSGDFIRPPDLELTKFSAWFTFMKGDADFSNNEISVCEPFGCDKMGSTSAGGGGGGTGNVVGPVSSIQDGIVRFADTSGKVIKDSPVVMDDAGAFNFLDVASTTRASHPCPSMTTLQRLALPLGSDGDCVFDLDFQATYMSRMNGRWGDVTVREPWVSGYDYKEGDFVEVVNLYSLNANKDFTAGASLSDDYFAGNLDFLSILPITTCTVSGGEVTLNGTQIDITAGKGLIVTKSAVTTWPDETRVTWSDVTGATILVPDGWNTVYMDTTGISHIVSGRPNAIMYKTNIVLAIVNPTLGNVSDRRGPCFDAGATIRDLNYVLGPLFKGFEYFGNANLTMKRNPGEIYAQGINFDGENQTIKDYPAVITVPIAYYVTRAAEVATDTFDIDTMQYDNGGVLTTLTNNRYSYNRIYVIAGGITAVQYGQKEYATLSGAITGVTSDASVFVENTDVAANGRWVATVVFLKGATDLSNPAQATFLNCGIFGCGQSTGGSAASGAGGDVFGPTGAIQDNITTFADATGKVIKDSGIASSVITGLQTASHTHANKVTLDVIKSNGTATEFLAGDGTYKVPVDTNTITLVIDTLVSTSTTSALSANQGRILDGRVTTNATNITTLQGTSHSHTNKTVLDAVPSTMCTSGQILKSIGATFTCQADTDTNSGGDVDGPGGSEDNRLTLFDGISGKLIKQGGATYNGLDLTLFYEGGDPFWSTRLIVTGDDMGNPRGIFAPDYLQWASSGDNFLFTLNNPPNQTASYALSFPNAAPAVNQILQSNAAGQLSWINTPPSGDVVGPDTATDLAIAIYDTATGKKIKNSGVTIDASNNISTPGTITATGQIVSTVFNNGASLAFNFNNGNVQYSSLSCGASVLSNMVDGGSYQVIIQGATAGTCAFTHAGLTFRYSPANGNTTAASHSVYSLTRAGTIVYVSWITGF